MRRETSGSRCGAQGVGGGLRAVVGLALATTVLGGPWVAGEAAAQPGGYTFKIFRVESGLYPFVQIYFRTFDQAMEPLLNLNELNIGIMIKGRAYDPGKGQYRIDSIRTRQEAVRSVLVLDASGSMVGKPCEAARDAAARYIDRKRPQDQVAIIVMADGKDGYDILSAFDRDQKALGDRLADVQCTAKTSRLYDAIGAALGMSAMVGQGRTQTGDVDYVASTSIVVFSDGKDEGSAVTRAELNTRITSLGVPVPIYSLACGESQDFRNLESLSKNSAGKYYEVGDVLTRMTRVVESIQNILQSDYVVTFRSYVPVDGELHPMKLGVEYPSKSGQITYQEAKFEALEPPPIEPITKRVKALAELIPKRADNDPYMGSVAPVAQ